MDWCSVSRADRRVWVASPYRHPCAPIAREHAVGRLGALAPGGIIRKVLCGIARPAIEQSLDRAPSRLDRIGPLEQSGIPDQTIIDQRLVAHGRERLEIVVVSKVPADT